MLSRAAVSGTVLVPLSRVTDREMHGEAIGRRHDQIVYRRLLYKKQVSSALFPEGPRAYQHHMEAP